jgi:transcriptional regulator GlxA family with amidase domain
VRLHPANISLDVHASITSFDAEFPEGADYVIVPAVHDPQEPRLLEWLRAQSARGATIMSICDGAKVLAHAGLLNGRSATAHWYALDDLRREFATTQWRQDRRYVFEDGVATTSGVSASLPATLALLERIAGPTATHAFAEQLGVTDWGAEHDGASFRLSGGAVRVALMIRSRGRTPERMINSALLNQPLGRILDATLDEIESDYESATAAFVALQLEHVRGAPEVTTSP